MFPAGKIRADSDQHCIQVNECTGDGSILAVKSWYVLPPKSKRSSPKMDIRFLKRSDFFCGNRRRPLCGTSAQPFSGATGSSVLDFGHTWFSMDSNLAPSSGWLPIYVLTPTMVV